VGRNRALLSISTIVFVTAVSTVTLQLPAGASGTATVEIKTVLSQNNVQVSSILAGSTIYDEALIGGSQGPTTGTITFDVIPGSTCSGAPVAEDTEPVGNFFTLTNALGPFSAGPYSVSTTYSGDAVYAPSIGPCETFTVTPVLPNFETNILRQGQPVSGSLPAGVSISDLASVLGPFGYGTGTVDFAFFDNAGCAGSPAGTETQTINGGIALSTVYGPLSQGSYSFLASYSGDLALEPATAQCESVTIFQSAVDVTTQIHVGQSISNTTFAGRSVTDEAVVNGNYGTPTGSVTFDLFNSANCTGTAFATDVEGLSGGNATSASFGPLAAGSYSFMATYSGDITYIGGSGSCETLTVLPVYPQIQTLIHVGQGIANLAFAGSSVTDEADVGGSSGNATGAVNFVLYNGSSCNGAIVGTDTQSLINGGFNTQSAFSRSFGPLAAGSYSFLATYVGDVTYQPAVAPCEVLTVMPNFPSITTLVGGPQGIGNFLPQGALVFDQADVAGNFGPATGTVSFVLYDGNSCNGTIVDTDTEGLGSGLFGPQLSTSKSFGPLGAGAYSFLASYSGDVTYQPATATCEPLTIFPVVSTVTTTILQSGSPVTSVLAGSTVSDQASVTGGLGAGTGTVAFSLFSGPSCVDPPIAGDTAPLVAGVATSVPFGPFKAGSYSFEAVSSGDGTYAPATGSCEVLTVTPSPSTVATNVLQGGSPVTSIRAGSTASDQAIVSGSVGPGTGSVQFSLFAGAACAGAPIGSDSEPLGGGVATTIPFGPFAVGTYSFLANYGGDFFYEASSGPCEVLTVTPNASSVTTAILQGGVNVTNVLAGSSVSDQASVTGAFGTPTGTVGISLFGGSTCSGTAVSSDSEALVGGVATSTSFGPLSSGPYSFLATYGGDITYQGSTGPCETLTVTKPVVPNHSLGYWKTHNDPTADLLPQYLGKFKVATFAQATSILGGTDCGSSGVLNCMAAMLLAAELNLAQGGPTCIANTVADANALLIKHSYSGLKSYSLSVADKTAATNLHAKLSAYNIEGIPTC
jgi:hypothetical protein